MSSKFNQSDINEALDILSHHGIEGMHWGDRNGPPYPLGEGQKSASEKKAAKGSSGGGSSSKKKDKKKKLSVEQIQKMEEEAYAEMDPEKRKAKIKENSDIEMALKYSKEFSNDEIQEIYNRALLLSKVKDLNTKEQNRNKEPKKDGTGKKIATAVGSTVGTLATVNKLTKLLGFGDNVVGNTVSKVTKPLAKKVDKVFTSTVFDVFTWAIGKEATTAASADLLKWLKDTRLSTSTAVRVI